MPRRLLLIGLLLLASPGEAEAQLGWVKRLFGGGKPTRESVAESVTDSATGRLRNAADRAVRERTKSGADSAAAASGSADGVSRGGAVGTGAVTAGGMTTQVDPGAPRTVPDALVAEGTRLDAEFRESPSADLAKRRFRHWRRLALLEPTNAEFQLQAEQAETELQEVLELDTQKRDSLTTVKRIEGDLDLASSALRMNSISDVEAITTRVLERDPTNSAALDLQRKARAAESARRLRLALMTAGASLLALGILVAAFWRRIFPKSEEDGGKAAGSARAAADARTGGAAYLQVIDGVARGRLVTISGDVFRIGAQGAVSEADTDRNDLIISDSDAAVSRFHCSILRKKKDYFVTDSSRNGTKVNDQLLARGESRRLRDGDELSIAGVSVIKFVRA
ncbi:MAG: FHA domain-containing protein [Gemmatimonadaceae bacterium]|nr:FHA domain-containing protein [Gemmatimonadaceae bacterium]